MRRETFHTPGPVRLNLELPTGVIEIETGESEDTHVELEAVSGDEQVREMVESARIEAVRRGDGHEVIVEVRTRHGVWISFSRGPDIRIGSPEMRMRVTCPKGAELDVRTKSADLSARGEYGSADVKTASGDVSVDHAADVDVKTASGDIHVDEVAGSLDVKSASGDVFVGSVGREANIQLVSGDIFIREANDSVSANTVSGDHRLEAVLKGRMELRAISGDISVGVRRGSRVFIDANTVSGSTSSEFELSDAPAPPPPPPPPPPAGSGSSRAATSSAGEAAAQGPLVEVFAKTVSGDVRIERAPAPPQTAELSERP